MSPISIAAVVLAATCAAATIGLLAQRLLPDHHLGNETKDTVRLAIGTITAMTALILGLATASAKNTFDLACRNVNDTAVDRITIDLWLAVTFFSYGLFAGRNATVMLALFLCALSVSSAIFLIGLPCWGDRSP
jgi:hypothetical protein